MYGHLSASEMAVAFFLPRPDICQMMELPRFISQPLVSGRYEWGGKSAIKLRGRCFLGWLMFAARDAKL